MKISKFLRNKVNETYITNEFTNLDLFRKVEELANTETKQGKEYFINILKQLDMGKLGHELKEPRKLNMAKIKM
jgi:hypothetical protein